MKEVNYPEVCLHLPYYTEGPVKDAKNNIYFTSPSSGGIYKMTPDLQYSEWAKASSPNGQVILENSDHLICDSGLGTIARYDENGLFLTNEIDRFCGGKAVFVPNDIIVDSTKIIYFTDSVRYHGKVFCIHPDGYEHVVASNLDYPNGLAKSADGKFLFVAESYKNRILVFGLNSDGLPESSFEVFSDLPSNGIKNVTSNLPDGIKLDEFNNLWVAHYGMGVLQVLSPKGNLINTIPTNIPLTSNLFILRNEIIISGGYSEPGPGAISKIV